MILHITVVKVWQQDILLIRWDSSENYKKKKKNKGTGRKLKVTGRTMRKWMKRWTIPVNIIDTLNLNVATRGLNKFYT